MYGYEVVDQSMYQSITKPPQSITKLPQSYPNSRYNEAAREFVVDQSMYHASLLIMAIIVQVGLTKLLLPNTYSTHSARAPFRRRAYLWQDVKTSVVVENASPNVVEMNPRGHGLGSECNASRARSLGKEVMFDFEHSAVRLTSTEQDLKKALMESRSFQSNLVEDVMITKMLQHWVVVQWWFSCLGLMFGSSSFSKCWGLEWCLRCYAMESIMNEEADTDIISQCEPVEVSLDAEVQPDVNSLI
ncbi:hypothetical protein Tco_0943674 [Tanacetum coccineum]